MNLINISFDDDMKLLVLQGKKCCTTRQKLLGDRGDVFLVGDKLFRIIDIYRESHPFESRWYTLEGFKSTLDFISRIEEIYPELAKVSTRLVDFHEVYCHIFAQVSPEYYSMAVVGCAHEGVTAKIIEIEGYKFEVVMYLDRRSPIIRQKAQKEE